MLADFSGLMEVIKKAAMETVENGKPSGVYFGKVVSLDPFTVNISQNLPLKENVLTLGKHITDFSAGFSVPRKMWNGLCEGDELILIREQGGQRYIIVDWTKRVDEENRTARVMEGEVTAISPLSIKVNEYLTLTKDQLIICRNVTDYSTYLSFDNPDIKQKVQIYDKAETEPLSGTVEPGAEPHDPGVNDAVIEKTADIQFAKKEYDGSNQLPAYHEVTIYNGMAIGDKVLLVKERSLQKWFIVDYTHKVK